MKRLLTVCILLPFSSFCQEIRFISNMGYVIGESPKVKKVMLFNDAGFHYQFSSHKKFFLLAGVSASKINYNSATLTDNKKFESRFFLNLPLIIRKYIVVSAKSKIYIDWGVVNSWLIFSKIETMEGTEKTRNRGYHISFAGWLGFKTALGKKNDLDFGFTYLTDQYSKYAVGEKFKYGQRCLHISVYQLL